MLKSVKLVGFKSFADRAQLEFRPGITVLVGPNGTGKSNIVDAIAWVLGTQSVRAIRTAKMEEVIFSGTVNRPALHHAEVTLVLEPTKSEHFDAKELALTRRLYRDGTSEYEINRVPCRLLDITELLSDLGVGKSQHVIVGQGQIESILAATPEEHRQVIEEAAGVLKHKLRQQRAERRLQLTETDLVRLTDLLEEIGRQMRPLRRQAKNAERRGRLSRELQQLCLLKAQRQLEEIDQKQAEVHRQQTGLSSSRTVLEQQARQLSAQRSQDSKNLEEQTRTLEATTAAAAQLETVAERLRRILSVAKERGRAIRMQLTTSEERKADWESERQDLQTSLTEQQVLIIAAAHKADLAKQAYQVWEESDRRWQNQPEIWSGEGEVASLRGELHAGEESSRREEREAAGLTRRSEWVTQQIQAQTQEQNQLVEQISQHERRLAEIRNAIGAIQTRRAEVEQEKEQYQTDRIPYQTEKTSLTALIKAAKMSSSLKGSNGQKQGHPAAATETLLEQLNPPEVWIPGVRAALEGWESAWLFDQQGNLQEEIARQFQQPGHNSFSALRPPPLQPQLVSHPARKIGPSLGVQPLLEFLPSATGWGAVLLADVVVVEGWEQGWTIVTDHPILRAVTRSGDLFTHFGFRLGQEQKSQQEHSVRFRKVEQEISRLDRLLGKTQRQILDLQTELTVQQTQLAKEQNRLTVCRNHLHRIEASLDEFNGERGRLEERLSALSSLQQERSSNLVRLREQIQQLEGTDQSMSSDWQQEEKERAEHQVRGPQLLAEWQERQSEHRAGQERKVWLEERLQVLENSLDEQLSPSWGTEQLEQLDRLDQAGDMLRDTIQQELERLRSDQAEQRQRQQQSRDQLNQVIKQADQVQQQLHREQTLASELAVSDTELKGRREAVLENLRRDADASETEAKDADWPEGIDLEADLNQLIETGRAQLKRMGPVNPLAEEEYQKLAERHQFLSEQLDDVERSRNELNKVISALEEEISTRFTEAFTEVEQAFAENFSTLFPGGQGKLRLTNPDQPHISGVEIEAQPLGKKVRRLSLLSGGERSLAALAFLFGVYGTQQSPFYILDEVDAALDDANLIRFMRLMEKFRPHTQLVVITHQQRTVAAADVLYGVTMEPGGSTQVVAQPISEQAQAETLLVPV